MNTKDIPEGWWLNCTVLADIKGEWIVGVLKEGKTTWLTMEAKSGFTNPEDAYMYGIKWIIGYNNMLIEKKNKKDISYTELG